MPGLSLQVLPERYGVARLSPQHDLPEWAVQGSFYSITRTTDELSIVCMERNIPKGLTCEKGWLCMKVLGPLDFSLVGIMANLSSALAQVGVSLFAISTYDTDYLLVKADSSDTSTAALAAAGHTVIAG